MKASIRILLLCGIFVLSTFSCKKEKGNFEPIEIKKITDFGCDDCYLLLKPEYSNDTYYVIYSEDNFTKYLKYIPGENIPSIDFEKYFLIIGAKWFGTGAEILEEKAETNNIEIVYHVTFLTDISAVALGISYHAFIEKPVKEKAVRVEITIKP
jgi:hypothetical protein